MTIDRWSRGRRQAARVSSVRSRPRRDPIGQDPFRVLPALDLMAFPAQAAQGGTDTVDLPSRELAARRCSRPSIAEGERGICGSCPVSGSWEPWRPHPMSPAGDAGRGGRIERHLYGRAPPRRARSSASRSPGGSRSIGTTETQWRGNLMNDERPQMHMALLRHNRPACHWHGRAQRKWPNSM